MNNGKLIELMNKAYVLAEDVDNGRASGNDVADKLEDYAKSICEIRIVDYTERYCRRMAKKARGE